MSRSARQCRFTDMAFSRFAMPTLSFRPFLHCFRPPSLPRAFLQPCFLPSAPFLRVGDGDRARSFSAGVGGGVRLTAISHSLSLRPSPSRGRRRRRPHRPWAATSVEAQALSQQGLTPSHLSRKEGRCRLFLPTEPPRRQQQRQTYQEQRQSNGRSSNIPHSIETRVILVYSG